MSIRAVLLAGLLVITASLAACDKNEVEQLQIQKVTYVDDVEPIMQKHCAECHVAGAQGAETTGFLLDSYESLMKGSRLGSVIDPGSAKTSSLYNMVSGKGNLAITMPHGKDTISAEEIETIRVWIENGAIEN
jgi:mono/diheme cytochrome c family protein